MPISQDSGMHRRSTTINGPKRMEREAARVRTTCRARSYGRPNGYSDQSSRQRRDVSQDLSACGVKVLGPGFRGGLTQRRMLPVTLLGCCSLLANCSCKSRAPTFTFQIADSCACSPTSMLVYAFRNNPGPYPVRPISTMYCVRLQYCIPIHALVTTRWCAC